MKYRIIIIVLIFASVTVAIDISVGLSMPGGIKYPEYVKDIYNNSYALELVDMTFGATVLLCLNNLSYDILWLHSRRDELLGTARSTTENHLQKYGDIYIDNNNSYYYYNELSFMVGYNIKHNNITIVPQIGYKWNKYYIHVYGYEDGYYDEYIDYYNSVSFLSVGSEFEISLERHHIGIGVNYKHSFVNNENAIPLSIMYRIKSTNNQGDTGMFSASMYGQYDLLDNWTKFKLYGIISYNFSF